MHWIEIPFSEIHSKDAKHHKEVLCGCRRGFGSDALPALFAALRPHKILDYH
jgi:hypothetical protein